MKETANDFRHLLPFDVKPIEDEFVDVLFERGVLDRSSSL